MNINVYRLNSIISSNKKEILDVGDAFLSSINDELFDEDITLLENAKKPLFNVIFVETGGAEIKLLNLYKKINNPFIIITHNRFNSLAASLEIKTFLENEKKDVVILSEDEKTIASFIKRYVKLFLAKEEMKNANLGVIGKPSDWLIASKVDYKKIKEKFNLNMVDIPMEELFSEIEKHEYVSPISYPELIKKANNKVVLEEALYIYGALTRLVKKYQLKGLTIRCFDLIAKYRSTACLALALLNTEGIISACEGDVPALLTMYIIYVVTKQPTFQCNPSNIDIEKGILNLAHCTIPFNMVSKYSLPTHFESNLSIGIQGELKKTPVTICKIWPNLESIIVIPGEIIENTTFHDCCRSQIKVKCDDEALFDIFKFPFGNHLVLAYGSIQGPLFSFLDYLNAIYK